jgi:hypothetical protein
MQCDNTLKESVVCRYNVSTLLEVYIVQKAPLHCKEALQLQDSTLWKVNAVVNLKCECLCKEKHHHPKCQEINEYLSGSITWKGSCSNLHFRHCCPSHSSHVGMDSLKEHSKIMCKVQLLYAGHATKKVSKDVGESCWSIFVSAYPQKLGGFTSTIFILCIASTCVYQSWTLR